MTTNLRRIFRAALLLSVLTTSGAHAVCDQSAASTADQDLWNTHGCWQAFFLWEYRAYDERGGDWSGRGWNDACNSRLEYPKHWNASYLVTYGLLDNLAQSWHGTVDYRAAGEARSSSFHNSLYHTVVDDNGIFGSFSPQVFGPDRLATSCPLYDPGVSNANPASRGGDYMHEGWHAWLHKYGWNNGNVGGHRPGPQGNCTFSACDYFYFHGVGAYAFGAMYQTDGTANRFHSPNQAQVEYLCDISDQPKAWVPASVRLAAAADANTRASQRFINGPGYSCGDPRPW